MKKLSIELPEELAEWLKHEAEREHRSISGQARFFLDQKRLTEADNAAQEKEAEPCAR